MKQCIFVIFTLMFCSIIYAQADAWLWVQQAGGMNEDGVQSLVTDSSGNSYITGYLMGSATFGSTALTNSGNADVFVAKIDSNGDWLWAQQAGGLGYDAGYSIAIDDSGDCYISGTFNETATFGDFSLTSGGYSDIFIAKIDSNGNWLWVQQAGGPDVDDGFGIATDDNGNCYITGVFNGTATFGSSSLTTNDYIEIFVSKLDSSGVFQWARQAGGLNDDNACCIAVDSNGNCYLTGSFQNTASFGSTTITSVGSPDVFVAKIDPEGSFLWAQQAGGLNDEKGSRISIDNDGNSYVTGYFRDSATFGSTTLTSYGYKDIFVAKLDSTGVFQWARQAGGQSNDFGYGICCDTLGNCYCTGCFANTATFGNTSLTSNGSYDMFISKLDIDGNFLWTQQAGGPGFMEAGYGIDNASDGSVYVTGSFEDAATFGASFLASNGSYDIFVAKIDPESVPVYDELIAPMAYVSHLGNAYPNPFRAGSFCTIKADVPAREIGLFTIYNLRGQVLQSHNLSSGAHEISISTTKLAPGMYFYRLKTPSLCEVKKFVVL